MKKKFAFNLIDVIVVIALGLLACGIIWRQELTKQIELRDTKNTVEVICTVSFYSAENLPADGAEVELLAGNKGSLSYVKTQGGTSQIYMRLSTVELESGYYLEDGTKLLVEKDYAFHSNLAEYTVKVLSLEEVEEGN